MKDFSGELDWLEFSFITTKDRGVSSDSIYLELCGAPGSLKQVFSSLDFPSSPLLSSYISSIISLRFS